MYNINLYSYWKKPYTSDSYFSIHPLNEEGNEKYYSDKSHVRHYLKRIDPFVFKSIIGVDYNTLVEQQKSDIQTLRKLKEKGFSSNSSEKMDFVIENNKNDNNIDVSKNKSNYNHEEKKISNDYNLNINNHDLYKKININTIKKCNTTRAISSYKKMRDFKDIYGYDNKPNFCSNGEKYQYAINSMIKNNLDENDYIIKQQRKYDGFTARETPFIKKDRPSSSSFEHFKNRLKNTLKCLNKRRAKNIKEMKNNLCNQTSINFLKRYHLPDLIKIANSKQVISKQKIGFSKEMGEKYNPYSLITPSKNRTRRNIFGALFEY